MSLVLLCPVFDGIFLLLHHPYLCHYNLTMWQGLIELIISLLGLKSYSECETKRQWWALMKSAQLCSALSPSSSIHRNQCYSYRSMNGAWADNWIHGFCLIIHRSCSNGFLSMEQLEGEGGHSWRRGALNYSLSQPLSSINLLLHQKNIVVHAGGALE